MAVNQKLKRIVESIKYSHRLKQADIAEQLGVKTTYLSDMINGRVPFSDKFKERLFEVYPDCVLTGDGEMLKRDATVQNNQNPIQAHIASSAPCNSETALSKTLNMLAESQAQLSKSQEHIDRLLSIIEQITATNKAHSNNAESQAH